MGKARQPGSHPGVHHPGSDISTLEDHGCGRDPALVGIPRCFSVVGIGSPDMMVGNLANPRSSPACFFEVFLEAAFMVCELLVVLRGGDKLPGRMAWCCHNESHLLPVGLAEC